MPPQLNLLVKEKFRATLSTRLGILSTQNHFAARWLFTEGSRGSQSHQLSGHTNPGTSFFQENRTDHQVDHPPQKFHLISRRQKWVCAWGGHSKSLPKSMYLLTWLAPV